MRGLCECLYVVFVCFMNVQTKKRYTSNILKDIRPIWKHPPHHNHHTTSRSGRRVLWTSQKTTTTTTVRNRHLQPLRRTVPQVEAERTTRRRNGSGSGRRDDARRAARGSRPCGSRAPDAVSNRSVCPAPRPSATPADSTGRPPTATGFVATTPRSARRLFATRSERREAWRTVRVARSPSMLHGPGPRRMWTQTAKRRVPSPAAGRDARRQQQHGEPNHLPFPSPPFTHGRHGP